MIFSGHQVKRVEADTSLGSILYHHAAGRQTLEADAPPLDPNSTIVLASAGKFITHIAALQLVERGLIALDEPVSKHLPELDVLPLLLSRRGGRGDDDADTALFDLRPPTNKITLRHLLLHSSGLSDPEGPLLAAYRASDAAKKQEFNDDVHPVVKEFSFPLVFEPGEGFAYGCSIHWTTLLIRRLTGTFVEHIREGVFDPLGMKTATYAPRDKAEVWNSRLRMVERLDSGRLVPADDASQGLICSMADMSVLMADLVSSSPKLLRQKQLVDLLFEGQFAPSNAAMEGLRGDPENYGFCTGKSSTPPAVNWSAAGLVVEDEPFPASCIPRGTVVWEGMPNVMWAMNREKELGAFFATQLIPVGDEMANELALTFMKDVWTQFT